MFQHTDKWGDTLTVDEGTFQIGVMSITLLEDQCVSLGRSMRTNDYWSSGEGLESAIRFHFYHEDEDSREIEIQVGLEVDSVMLDRIAAKVLIEELSPRKSWGTRVQTAATADLKPRGVKRQWWLFPFDALEEILEAEPVSRTAVLAANAQRIPGFTHGMLDVLRAREGGREVALDLVCQVLEHGAAKYSPNNWRTAADDLVAFRREYFSAIVRHLTADANGAGETIDPDSGLPHMSHAICSGLFWTWHEMRVEGRTIGSGAFGAG